MMRNPYVMLLLLACAALAGGRASAADATVSCIPGGGGRLVMEIHGAFEDSVDWGNEGTVCEGGPRPEGDALRLMFSREADGLLVVLGITGLQPGVTGEGFLANLTVVRQGLGEFYGTLGADACVVEVARNEPDPSAADAYRVSGRGRCVAPVEAIAREGEIRVAPFEFAGLAHWALEEEAD